MESISIDADDDQVLHNGNNHFDTAETALTQEEDANKTNITNIITDSELDPNTLFLLTHPQLLSISTALLKTLIHKDLLKVTVHMTTLFIQQKSRQIVINEQIKESVRKSNEDPNSAVAKATEKYDRVWNQHFEELKQYKNLTGHCNVPRKYPDNPTLSRWVQNQRRKEGSNSLSLERKEALEEIGFRWRIDVDAQNKKIWEERCTQLMEYKAEMGDTNVPFNYPPNPSLGRWVRKMKEKARDGKLSRERKEALEELGFDWQLILTPKDARSDDIRRWNLRFNQLLAFKEEHGHANVPRNYPPNPKLAIWVKSMRYARKCKYKKLSEDRIIALDRLGFTWNLLPSKYSDKSLEERWEHWYNMYIEWQSLRERAEAKGETFAMSAFSLGLQGWCTNQRDMNNRGVLPPERREKLEEIGFDWDTGIKKKPDDLKEMDRVQMWEYRFNQLLEYRDQYGDVDVPQHFSENKHLGQWVKTQRERYSKGKLAEDRQARLEEVGFQWCGIRRKN